MAGEETTRKTAWLLLAGPRLRLGRCVAPGRARHSGRTVFSSHLGWDAVDQCQEGEVAERHHVVGRSLRGAGHRADARCRVTGDADDAGGFCSPEELAAVVGAFEQAGAGRRVGAGAVSFAVDLDLWCARRLSRWCQIAATDVDCGQQRQPGRVLWKNCNSLHQSPPSIGSVSIRSKLRRRQG